MIGNQLKGFRDFPDKYFASEHSDALLANPFRVVMTGLCQEKGTIICHAREI
jgi:hypothetical protein